MPRYVGLLRGVNVGGKHKIPMAELRAVVEGLGYTDVVTYIQSGNVVFSGGKRVSPASLEAAIARRFGIEIAVMLRTGIELEAVVDANPFPRADPSKLHVGFMAETPPAAAVTKLDADRFAPDEVAFRGRELYLHLPDGIGRSKLPPYLDRQLTVPTTVRNWNSVNKLLELAR